MRLTGYLQFNSVSYQRFVLVLVLSEVLTFMTEDKKHVTYEEWRKSRENLLDRINDVDEKHTNSIRDLKEKIVEGNMYQKQTYEVQKETNEQIKIMNDTNYKQWDAIKNINYTVKKHGNDIQKIEGSISEKQKNSVQITVAFISGGFGVLIAAIGLAQYLF